MKPQMNADERRFVILNLKLICALMAAFVLLGCMGKPNQANIELRKKNQSLEARIAELNRVHEADAATIRALEQQRGALPTLPQNRLEKLFTAHGLLLSRLSTADDQGIRVYVVPTDETGDEIKAAGSFVVEAFDLAKQADNLAGRWQFTTDQARQNWHGSALLYAYVLVCPWQQVPQHRQITLKVTFRDELTGRQLSVQKVLDVQHAP